jgi:hypothetical protein
MREKEWCRITDFTEALRIARGIFAGRREREKTETPVALKTSISHGFAAVTECNSAGEHGAQMARAGPAGGVKF